MARGSMAGAAANHHAGSYLRTKVMTATPEQLQMMLYDGAIRFCEQARMALLERNWEQSYQLISRVQKILLEMTCALRHDVSPELCRRLAALYNFAYRNLIDANVGHSVRALDEALDVLRYQRETWAMLLHQLAQQKAAALAQGLDVPPPEARMEASISIQG